MARDKKKTIANVTMEQAQEASSNYATAANDLSKIENKMNERINRIKTEYADEITELTDKKTEQMEVLEVFAKEQKTSWGKKKSMELLHTVIGFRTGTPKVVKDKKFTWDAILELIKKKKAFASFVRSKDEINKEAILAEKDDKVLSQLRDECYIQVDQDETFYVDAKKEELQPA